MAINLLAWKSVDGEVVYIQENETGQVILGANYTRIPGLDRVVSNDLSAPEDFNAQDASEVPVTPAGNLGSTNVQDALEELQGDIDGFTPDHGGLTGLGDDDHPQYLNDTRFALKSVGDLSDVDLTGIQNDQVLSWNGTTLVPTINSNGFIIFPIWAEEGGGLSNNNPQYSFGNGATGNIGITLPIDCEAFAMSMHADTGGTTVSIQLMQNGAAITSQLFNGDQDFATFGSPFSFTAGQLVGFRTDIETGSYSDVRVCVWFRVRASQASTSVLNDLLDTSLGSITSGQIIQYNGSNYVPLTLDATAVGLGNVDNTSDADKPVSTAQQTALDLKYDASNPAGYIDATALSDFETTTQLNARDVANRDRANHTGSQLASTISDLPSAIQANETDTTLTIIGNTLRYIGEDGTNQDVDLSLYLDDTNAARIVSGTLAAGTGIITFTRDDSSTFTVDASELLDNQNASEVPVTPSGNLTSTDVQAALEELQTDVDNKVDKVVSTDNSVVKFNGTTGDVQNTAVTIDDNNNLGVLVDNPIHNIQVGEQFNNTPGPANVQNTEIAQYSGTANNNGTATIGLYESVPAAFPGDYGARIRYDASTNLLEFATVQAGVETNAFTFDRATQTATFNGDIDGNTANQAKNFADPTDPQDLTTLLYFQQRNDSVKVRNTATGNLNTGVATFNSFTTTDELGSTLGQFTFATNGITPNFTGTVELTFTCELSGSATRACVGFRWSHNGDVGPWNRETYIRNASGHNETTAKVVTTISVTAGQAIQIQHDNFAGGGTVTSPTNGVEFIIKRIG